MVFSSLSFLVVFLPILFITYFLVPMKMRGTRNFVLLAFSLGFYGYSGPKLLLLMLASITINYLTGIYVNKSETIHKKTALALAISLNIGLIIYFKYAGFLVESINSFKLDLPIPQIILPIGISFFTFQGLSYVIDVYRGNAKVQKNPLKVALYIALFPQLVAGPIVRYTTIAEAIDDRQESIELFSEGTVRFIYGLAKKMVLANAFGEIADVAFAGSALTASFAWLGAIAYALQIYFDFSAYSDMAIGLGKMFGFHFLENFNYPYVASSITDFWRRWHISLSTWFRDYVYIPLGGNRCSKSRHILNMLIVWLLTGLWHGASWNFVLWGLWYFLLLAGEKYLWHNVLKKLPKVMAHSYSMLLVLLGWVLFRAADFTSVKIYLLAMFKWRLEGIDGKTVYYFLEYWPEWLLGFFLIFPIYPYLKGIWPKEKHWPLWWGIIEKGFALLLLLISYTKLLNGAFNPFIYFRF